MPDVFVGLDPGLDGAIAVLTDEGFPLMTVAWPTIELPKTGGGIKRDYVDTGVRKLIATAMGAGTARIFVEKQHAFPKQGGVSNFSTGTGWGLLRGVLAGLEASYQTLTSHEWQKLMFSGLAKPAPRIAKKGKNAGQEVKVKASKVLGPVVCQQLWPKHDLRGSPRDRTPHDGICDALLIAEHCRRKYRGIAC